MNQGWVDFDLGVPPSCPDAQPLLPNSHQPGQNWSENGTHKIQVNPTHYRTPKLTELLEFLSEGGELLVDLDVEVVVCGLVGHGLTQPRRHEGLRQRLLTCK